MEKVVSHDILVGSMPLYLHDTKKLKHNKQLVENLRFRLVGHLTSTKSSKFTMAKNILCTLATFQFMESNTGVAKPLGVDRRKIRNVINKHLSLDTLNNAF